MKITKIITEWEDGKRYEINEAQVTNFLECGGNINFQLYLLMAFSTNLSGGINWIEIKDGK